MSTPTTSTRVPTTSHPLALTLTLMIAVFAFQLNASMLSPALVVMERELNTTASAIGLSQTAFFTAAALFSLFLPRLGDLVGRRKVLIGMLIATGVGCLISALAPNVGVLFVGRIIQGVAGPTVPMTLIMLRVQIPDEKMFARYMSIITAVNGGIAGVDALLGGWMAGTFGYRSIFWFMFALCVVAAVAIRFGTVESTSAETPPMDWKGVTALVVAIGALLIAFNEAGKLGAANWLLVLALIVVGVVGLVVFWKLESTVQHPLVHTHYLKERSTWALLLTTLFTMTGVFAIMNGIVPGFGQNADVGPGIDVAEISWLTLTPYALAGLIMGPISGALAAKFGYRRVLQAGLILTILGILLAVYVVDNPSGVLLLVISVWIGLSYAGMANIMLNGMGVVLSPKNNEGFLPGMNAGAFNLGAGVSFAVLFAIQTAAASAADPAWGYKASLFGGAALVVVAFLFSLLIPTSRPAEIPDSEK